MARATLALTLGLTLAAAAAARPAEQPKAKPPARGPAPLITEARLDANGRPVVVRTKYVRQPFMRLVPEKVGNAVVQRPTPVEILVPVTEHFPLANAHVHDITGKRLDPGQVRRRINGETPVLLSADGKAVDPFYLRGLRENVIVIVVPGEASWVTEPQP
jgi:hypothetical protein